MKRILFPSAMGLGVVVFALIASALLVQFNRMPVAVAERMPFVETFTVEGDVRMTDGESLPPGDVEVTLQSPMGRTVRTKTTEKQNYHYTATLMGFDAPVRVGDYLRIRALLLSQGPPRAQKEEPTPSTNPSATTEKRSQTALVEKTAAISTLDPPSQSNRILLADFEVMVGGEGATESTAELPTRLQAIAGTSAPSTLAEWEQLPLASLESLPQLRLDENIALTAEIWKTSREPNEPPLEVVLPSAADESALRALPLSAIGEELARSSFSWEKKQRGVSHTFTVPRAGVVALQVLNAAGVAVRRTQMSTPEGRFPQDLAWEWDGKDDSGDYAPEGTYTFVASLGSLNLGSSPSPYLVETVEEGKPTLRYVELSVANRVGDLMDACASPVRQERNGKFAFVHPVRLYRAKLDDKPERKSATFRGSDTVGTLAERFGLQIDAVPESATHVAKYRLVVRGGTLRGNPTLNELTARTSAKTQADFLALPLSQIMTADTKKPLVPDFQAEYTVTREVPPLSPEWGDRPRRESVSIVVTPSTTLQEFLDRLNRISGVVATIRGTSESVYHYGARLIAPNGAKLRLVRTQEGTTTRHLVANIRAAGVLARVASANVLPIGDGVTSIPIEARVIGLDGKEITDDLVSGTATQGSLLNGGVFLPSNGVYVAEYVPPVTGTNLETTVEVLSKTLSGKAASEAARGVRVADRQTVAVHVLGFTGAPSPTVAVGGKRPSSPAASPASTPPPPPETTSPPAEPPERTLPEEFPRGVVSSAPPLTTPAGLNADEVRKLAKVYSRMSPKRASELLLSLSTEQARAVLLNMKDRDAAKIFDAILSSSEEEEEDLSADPATARERAARKQSLLDILEGKRKSGRE